MGISFNHSYAQVCVCYYCLFFGFGFGFTWLQLILRLLLSNSVEHGEEDVMLMVFTRLEVPSRLCERFCFFSPFLL